jgi:hypothetical protein
MSANKAAWPHCPKCRRDLWQGFVGAPVRVIQGCAHCQLVFVDGKPVTRLDTVREEL